MSYIFDLKKGGGTSGQSTHPIFSYQKPIEPGKEYEGSQESEQRKGLTQGAYEQMRESEELDKQIERNIARGTSRMGERILGLPGDIVNFLQHITGKKAEEFPLPTSTELQEKSEKLTQGYTSPRNELEKKSDEFLGDVASMMLPGGPGYSLSRNIGIPLVANLAQEAIKRKTGSEKQGAWGKSALMFMLDLATARRGVSPGKGILPGSKTYVNELFNKAEQAIPQGATADATALQANLAQLKTRFQRGGTSPVTTKALQKIDEIESKITNGQIEVAELPAFRRTINASIEELGGWNVEVPPKLKKQAVGKLGEVKKQIIEAGENWGRQHSPDFYENWKNANEASSVLNKSNVVSNYIQRNFGNKLLSTGAKVLFGLGTATGAGFGSKYAPLTTALTGGVLASSTTAYTAGKMLYRVSKSPTLRKYYSNTVKAALNGQKAEMIQNLAVLDKKLKEEEDKEQALIYKLTKD